MTADELKNMTDGRKTEKFRIHTRIISHNLWNSTMGKDLKQCKKEYLKKHGAEFRRLRKTKKERLCNAALAAAKEGQNEV